ncbi:MAG: GrpB family protein [Actinomycetota bacterium]|nr:GrpB family protein [Actinomycetota bacterium]
MTRWALAARSGTTAVAGLAAKPVIDIAAGIDDPDDEVAYLPDLVAAGWDLRVREPGHRCLRAEPPVRARYAALKRSLSGRQWPDMNLNADAKGNPDTRAARGNPGVSRLPVRTGPAALTCSPQVMPVQTAPTRTL